METIFSFSSQLPFHPGGGGGGDPGQDSGDCRSPGQPLRVPVLSVRLGLGGADGGGREEEKESCSAPAVQPIERGRVGEEDEKKKRHSKKKKDFPPTPPPLLSPGIESQELTVCLVRPPLQAKKSSKT